METVTARLTQRNQPIIGPALQSRLAELRVLIAGCGLGSCLAEALVRLGVTRLVLVDNDRIQLHNLNRQSFQFDEVDQFKVVALGNRLREINPEVHVEEFCGLVTSGNVHQLVAQSDVIIDTIDFLDLSAIIALHDEALRQKKPVVSLFTAGWGAVGMYIAPEDRQVSWAREIFNVPPQSTELSYRQKFAEFFLKIQAQLNPAVGEFMHEVLAKMLDHRPCPAPNVIAGAQLASVLAQILLMKYLEGRSSELQAPKFLYLDLEAILDQSLRQI